MRFAHRHLFLKEEQTMKTLRWFIVFAVLALMLGVGAFAAGAAGTDPTGAPYVDNTSHVLGPNGSAWYRFQYTGDHSDITITLPDAILSDIDRGLSFEVFAPSQMKEWWTEDGIGAGSLRGHDLVWRGSSHEAGTWWIKVNNTKASEVPFQLMVEGDKVSFSPAAEPVTAVTLPLAAELFEGAVPDKALPVKLDAQAIPAKTTLWYRFPYSGEHDQIILKVPDGADENLRVEILTPEQAKEYWNVTPVGRGMPDSGDLIWSGNSHQAGDWYIKVINDNPYAVSLRMLLDIRENLRR
jgi:hypothetical protein